MTAKGADAVLSIPEALHAQATASVEKSRALNTPVRLTISGMLAGAYIGIGVVLMVATAGPIIEAGTGFGKLISGLVFGVALTIVVFAGADLATSAMMVLPQGVAMRTIGVWRATGTLAAIFTANLAGALLFSALIVASGVLQANGAANTMLQEMLTAKAHESPTELFVRGILCNLLVCLAVWMCARVRSEIAKIVLIFTAILAFISSGFEHVVANMTTYGIGLFGGYADATWALFGSNLLWVGLGNLIGGGLCVGLAYWAIGGRPRFAANVEPNAVTAPTAASVD